MDISVAVIVKAIKDTLDFEIPTHLFLCLVTSIILFVPIEYLRLIKVDWLQNDFGYIAGAILLFSTTNLVIKLPTHLFSFVLYWHNQKKIEKILPSKIQALTPIEKKYLAFFMVRNVPSIDFIGSDNTPRILSQKGFLHLRSQQTHTLLYGYDMDQTVREVLSSNPFLVEGAAGQIEVNFLMRNREDFYQDFVIDFEALRQSRLI
ncbi:MAG: super-infection exclusion protein B [Rhizobiales bacterium]|nr:super-infection exclusion protein B [Hyphomicrobiales bacterium]